MTENPQRLAESKLKMAQYPLTCRYHLIRLFSIAGCIVCLMALFSHTASANSGFEDPNDPSLFVPADKQHSSWLESIGPGQGPVRRNSVKADAHENVKSFYHARYCLSCHEGQQKNLHYARTELVCRDCHISKPVAGINNPNAAAYAEHRYEKVCAKCHENAGPGMGSYLIHEKPPWSSQTREGFPALYWSTMAILALAFGVFLFFMPYTSVWAWREIRQHWKQRGKTTQADGQTLLIERFSPGERWLHTTLIVCFMLLSLTGVAWMTIETEFGKLLALPFAGAEGTVWIHRLFGLLLLGIFSAHIIYLIRSAVIGKPGFLRGPDSLVWSWNDFKAIHQHMAWLFGRREHPVFDRWSWWQKFDYWAVWWGLVIVGTTGLVMFDSVLTTSVLPGWMMNVARWIHKVEAILAMAHIFVVHFFIESYRPSAFPLNAHIFHGAAELQALEQEHPAWIERMQNEGNLQQRVITQPPRAVQIAFFGFGLSMVALGLLLLLGMLLFAVELSF
ncbi:MAG: cytochrome b/b6 domain-containing protein [Candidatus Thiodiazotropha weberae]|uniref:cytochrome b/b6 domain-containing protein n=2 Tax=Candidatus Thiodiazotropha endoloripes TaxID=1818881 RepID=UPI00114C8F50|nr:cytochrome b/b6 domain-containing protein [Candidatus Thiodiazotropha endoloripes]MCG7899629.1 cytochrome b/b6 domain-containing protein [Candidatus Thiodiazotropha weberae]MCG7901131.1 cytochrome b/b6 domain-containing protein [Candidatus Thiodiazotropha weberae]